MIDLFKIGLKSFLLNPIFLSAIFSWFIAQFIKTFINLIYGRIHSFYELIEVLIWRTGGMPSSHSALVTSACTAIGFKNGVNSDLFMLSLILCMVVVRDAVGVRRSSGIQAHKLNQLGTELEEKGVIEKYEKTKEVNGHTPMQVIFGCILGFLVGCSFSLLK